MTNKERLDWDIMQYKAKLQANKGHNYAYWSEGLEKELERKGYNWWLDFEGQQSDETSSEGQAICVVDMLRTTGHYARIICGRSQNPQRIKMYSVTYKLKAKGTNS